MELELLGLVFKEHSGREIIDQFEKLKAPCAINEGSVYVALTRMRDAGWITIKKDPRGDGRTRLFKITAQGTVAWNARVQEFQRTLGLRPEAGR